MRRAAISVVLVSICALVSFAQTQSDRAVSLVEPDHPAATEPPLPAAASDARSPIMRFAPAALVAPATAPVATPAPAAAPAVPAADAEPALPTATTGTEPAEHSPQPAATIPAKTLFGAAATPAPLAARAIGFYSRGCLAGAVPIPIDGEVWQVMRLSRNRNWGHPELVRLVQRLAEDAAANDGWPGLLVGDISQPRGGPMLTGHNSHQVGLDADVWLTPMPERRLSAGEREALAATSMLGKDGIHADPEIFTPNHAALIRRAASYPEVERVLVHPGIKKAMCQETGVERTYFYKIRPYWGHHYHMHIRIGCPKDSSGCKAQAPASGDDGCGREIDDWIALLKKPVKPAPPSVAQKPRPEKHQITLDDLPSECRSVVAVGRPDIEGPAAHARKGTQAAQSQR